MCSIKIYFQPQTRTAIENTANEVKIVAKIFGNNTAIGVYLNHQTTR